MSKAFDRYGLDPPNDPTTIEARRGCGALRNCTGKSFWIYGSGLVIASKLERWTYHVHLGLACLLDGKRNLDFMSGSCLRHHQERLMRRSWLPILCCCQHDL